MVICIGVGLTLLGPWFPWHGLWAVLGLFFPVPGDVGLLLVYLCFPGLWGFCLVGCVGCAGMWVFGIFLSGVFVFGLMPLFSFDLGEVLSVFRFLGVI